MNFTEIRQQTAIAPVASTSSSLQLTPPSEPPYLKLGEFTKDYPPVEGIYEAQGLLYARESGWTLVDSVFEAMDERDKGYKFLSFREADIAARNKILNQPAVVMALLGDGGFMLTEDLIGLKDSAYELRSIYNRGIEYKKTKYNTADVEQKKKCNEFMNKLREQLSQINLSMWPVEVQCGFHKALLRPEFVTDDQYRRKVTEFERFYIDWKA